MALRLNNPVITLGGVNITTVVSSCTLTLERPQVSGQNTFGVSYQRRELHGLWDGSLKIDFHQNYASTGITQVLYNALALNAVVPCIVKAYDTVVSIDNPEWDFDVSVDSLPLVDGGPEDAATASVTLMLASAPIKDITS